MDTEEKVNENETNVAQVYELRGNREWRRKYAKTIARSIHVPFQKVYQRLKHDLRIQPEPCTPPKQ